MKKKTRQIRVEQEHHGERGDPFQKRKEKCSDKIRQDSEKISVEQSGASSVLQNNTERGVDPIREGRQTTTAKYTERWNIMR